MNYRLNANVNCMFFKYRYTFVTANIKMSKYKRHITIFTSITSAAVTLALVRQSVLQAQVDRRKFRSVMCRCIYSCPGFPECPLCRRVVNNACADVDKLKKAVDIVMETIVSKTEMDDPPDLGTEAGDKHQ